MAEVRMPKMGDGMEEGLVVEWLVGEGEHVEVDQLLAVIQTDKANVDLVAREAGTITSLLVPVGKTVPVGEPLAVIGGAGAAAAAPPPAQAARRVEPAPKAAVPAAPQAPAPAAAGERVKASPLARKLAAAGGVDLASLTGSGPGGRIVERDVQQASGRGPVPASPAPTPAAVPATAGAAYTESTVSPMRSAIARRTQQSVNEAPHFYTTVVIEMDRAQALLRELNADAGEAPKVTVNDLIVKACAVALMQSPEVNASWHDGVIRRYAEAHVGVAVGIDDGLIVPVVRNCERKTLRAISAEARELAGRARRGELQPEEYNGGTFSTSNLGMMGVEAFTAIINRPEAAILAIGGIVREPVVVGDTDEVAIRARMRVTLSSDHRVVDGVIAARFLGHVRAALESPYTLLA